MANCSFEENAHIRGKQCCLLWIYSALLSSTQLTITNVYVKHLRMKDPLNKHQLFFFFCSLSLSLWLSLLFTFIQSQQEHISIKIKKSMHIYKFSHVLFFPNTEVFPAHILFTTVQCLISSTCSSDIPVAAHCVVQRKTSSHRAHGTCCSHMLGITVWTTCQEWALSRSPLRHTQIKSVGCLNNCSTTSFTQMYTHTHIYTHTLARTHVCMQTPPHPPHTRTHTHMHPHTHACMHADTHPPTHTHTCTHKHAHTHPHACTHARTHAHTHTHTHSLADTQHTQ